MTDAMCAVLPLDVPVHGEKLDPLAFTDMFNRAEAEVVAVMLVRHLGRHGNAWRPINMTSLLEEDILSEPIVRAGIINPTRGRDALLEHGYIVIDQNAGTLAVTAAFVEKVAARWAKRAGATA